LKWYFPQSDNSPQLVFPNTILPLDWYFHLSRATCHHGFPLSPDFPSASISADRSKTSLQEAFVSVAFIDNGAHDYQEKGR